MSWPPECIIINNAVNKNDWVGCTPAATGIPASVLHLKHTHGKFALISQLPDSPESSLDPGADYRVEHFFIIVTKSHVVMNYLHNNAKKQTEVG